MLLLLLPCILFLQGALALDQEEITRKVMIKEKEFKCTFMLTSANSHVILDKSKVTCTPAKPKRKKVSKLEIEGQFGIYTVSFNINPSKITRVTLSPTKTTPGPTVLPTTSCALGNSKVCTQGLDGSCPTDMTLRCFGNNSDSNPANQGEECGCINTITLKDALTSNRNPLDPCLSSCVCIPNTLNLHCTTKSILITGGGSKENGGSTNLASSEIYGGPAGCVVPPLPSPRSGHFTFTTADGLVATCGGLDTKEGSFGYTNSCLVLKGSSSWEEDQHKMGNLDRKRYSGDVVTLSVGVYIMGGQFDNSSFLPTGKTVWKLGPSMQGGTSSTCGVAISQTSFFRIGGSTSVLEYDSSSTGGPTSDSGWKPQDTWPDLKHVRYQHACTLYGNKVVVAGGKVENGKYVEMIDLITKTISEGPDMLERRQWFGLATLGDGDKIRLLAFGGFPSYTGEVEELDEKTNSWKIVAEKLSENRAVFGYVAITEHTENMICNG